MYLLERSTNIERLKNITIISLLAVGLFSSVALSMISSALLKEVINR
jgi:hypothetical protein